MSHAESLLLILARHDAERARRDKMRAENSQYQRLHAALAESRRVVLASAAALERSRPEDA